VDLELKEGQRGLDAWNTWAGKCYSRDTDCPTGGMAIVLDGTVISAPVPQDPFFSSPNVQVTGGGSGFPKDEAKDLARILKYGGVPVQLEPQAAQTVSATLGKDSLRAGLIAGFVGVALVLILMILYYRSLALLVVAGLFLTGCLLWTTISILSKTSGLSLTLAGVTGIIVSIGVTVDSYVVFLERLKDDVRSGKSLRASTPRSFKSAWRTILAADIVSLIGAGVLWYLSVGSVRGFAFFLGLSTILDLVVTWFFVRPAALLVSQARVYRGVDVLGVHTGEAMLAGGTA
jgi:preprotein translocase subunit SecD